MKKKMIGLMLGMVLALSITACGGENASQSSNGTEKQQTNEQSTKPHKDTEDAKVSGSEEAAQQSGNKESEAADKAETGGTTEETTEPAEVVEKEVEEEAFWLSKENLQVPAFGSLAVEDRTALDGSVSYKISDTPFKPDIDAIEEALKNNENVKGIYNMSRSKSEDLDDFATYTEGDFYVYSTREFINGRFEDEEILTDLCVRFSTDYSMFNDISSISLSLGEIPQTNLSQEKVYSIAEDVYGSVIAEYLVYSASNANGPGKDERLDFYETITGEDGTRYSLERDFSKYSSDDPWSVRFYVGIEYPSFSTQNRYNYDNGGKELMYNSAKYTVSDITEGGLSDADFAQFSTMFPEYTGIDVGAKFIRNGMNRFSYEEETLHNGDVQYSFEMYELSTLLEDVVKYKQPTCNIEYTLKENAEGLYEVKAKFRSESVYRHAENFEAKKALEAMKEQVAVLMPYVDFSELVYTEGNTHYILEGTHTLLGVECKYSINFSISSNDGSWSGSITSVK
ncbi:MAG: hypothetical protein IJX63_00090 [Lachnospiraceae bacterium]|nr:hypothetical protein [Lachnospiraceae bacterium]